MGRCELCGLPRPPGQPPLDGEGRPPRVDWHPRHIQRVHRFPLVEFGTWGCSRCGRGFPVQASWAVDHRLDPDSYVRTFVVCPECAASVRPARLLVDLDRIATSGHPSLQELVERVRVQRRHEGDELVLRSEDTRRIAALEELPVRELVSELRARGLAEIA